MGISRNTSFWALALLVLSAGAGCKTSNAGSGGSSSTSSTGSSLSTDQSDTASRGGDGTLSIQQAFVLADNLFQFDPTINPQSTPAQNAQAIGTQTKSALGSCGTVTVSGTTVSINFGAAPGCMLAGGISVSGSVQATVTSSGGTTTVALGLTSLMIDGRSLSGSLSFATTNGTTFQTTVNLTSASGTLTGMVTIAGASQSFTMSGSVSYAQTDASESITLTNVVFMQGACYPSGGSITLTKGKISEVMTFTSSTPTTGKVTVSIGKLSYPSTLPTYGKCPPASG